MELKIVFLIASVFLIIVTFVVAYYSPYIGYSRLYAEIEIARWAHTLIAQKGIGRNCAVTNYSDINRIFESKGKKRLDNESSMPNFYVPCWKEMKLVDMRYYADYNVVSGVYRCEKEDLIQELQLAIYLEPNSIRYGDWCMVGTIKKEWNIPVGEATMFSLP